MANYSFYNSHSVPRIYVGEKDIAEIYATMSEEQFVLLVAATIAVSLLKIAAIAGEWIVIKSKSK